MFLLDLLDDVVIVVVLLLLGKVFEPSLADAEAWLLDDQIWIFFLLFDDTGSNVVIDKIVTSHCWLVLLVLYELTVDL